MTKKNWGIALMACCSVCLGLFSPTSDVLADSSKNVDLTDFTYIAPVTGGKDAIRRTELPFDVLVRLQRADRKDLLVINADGEIVPSKLFLDTTSTTQKTNSRKLAYFPVQKKAESGQIQYSFNFDTDGENTSISLTAPGGHTTADLNDYIVQVDRDNTRALGKLVGLKFYWKQGQNNFLAPILVQGSGDLEKWSVIDQGSVLSELKHDGTTLLKNSVRFSSFNGEYLRVSWPSDDPAFELQRIEGQFVKQQTNPPPWRNADIQCQTSAPDGECWFNIGRVPVQSIQLQVLNETNIAEVSPNYFIQGDLYSRSGAKRSWRKRGAIQQYRLTFDDSTVTQTVNSFPGHADPLWRIAYHSATAPPFPAQLQIKWRPVYLAFVAQSPGPYQLVFSAEQTTPRTDRLLETILKRSKKKLSNLEVVQIGPYRSNDMEVPYWTRELIETYILWGILVLGVMVLLWLAISLFRRMEKDSEGAA